jgi:hypothetical protein
MGNLFAESGLAPANVQNEYNQSLDMADAEYTAAVDDGSYTNFVNDSAGYGLAQWTTPGRKQALYNHAQAAGASVGDLTVQLDFLWNEIQGFPEVMNVLNGATTVLQASNAVLMGYERPADQGPAVQSTRAGYGQVYYDRFAVGSGGGFGDLFSALFGQAGAGLSMVLGLIRKFFEEIPPTFASFTKFLQEVFSYLPPEFVLIITFGMALMVAVGVIKLFFTR